MGDRGAMVAFAASISLADKSQFRRLREREREAEKILTTQSTSMEPHFEATRLYTVCSLVSLATFDLGRRILASLVGCDSGIFAPFSTIIVITCRSVAVLIVWPLRRV